MRFGGLVFLLLLACIYLTLAQGSYEDCCLKYAKFVPKKIYRMAAAYRLQETDGGCNIPAIVFTLRRGRMFCADPSHRWAVDLIKRINSRKHLKKQMRQG
ncbi:C-C motif chemokine 25-like [Anguilla rostrata]|uniref:Chemokine interleukin-8-like domain-containing protein n=1 Tax=Anguilla anguilla TaxID=7936 RepID=A0A9D3RYM3_ANGAN|nr:C-C motif chemokine 25-like [Anguilla anguilla]XP_035277145.1 C-C motif chemokine 25-like [Anguilla anguilla]XP_035277146.1 C-C motif chemokine 25-like [Anguilla anguilla]XP_035277147.1 C-C motif chemokine 25-like [Anguilla anguilla]KAG5848040.1 hypothetical protein ANANG_G00132620 [Anguilla anguilla]